MLKELLKLDPQKTFGSDGLDPVFFEVAIPIIATPVSPLWGGSHCLKRQPQFVVYLKGEIKLILTVIGLFLFALSIKSVGKTSQQSTDWLS